jgi:8-oxo-dGTP diphosphatase
MSTRSDSVPVVAKAYVVYGGKVLLMRRSATDTQQPGRFDIPGGSVEEGESVLQGVLREIREESGLAIEQDQIRELTDFGVGSNEPTVEKHVFLAQASTDTVTLSSEHNEYTWISPEEALRIFPHPFYSVALRHALEQQLL